MNNDQRKANVHQKIASNFPGRDLPDGAIRLLDDYTGSGQTLNKAARALRKEGGLNHPIAPFTLAQIRWKLGDKGFVCDLKSLSLKQKPYCAERKTGKNGVLSF